MGSNQRGCGVIYWYLYHDAASSYGIIGKRTTAWYHGAIPDVLGNRYALQLPR